MARSRVDFRNLAVSVQAMFWVGGRTGLEMAQRILSVEIHGKFPASWGRSTLTSLPTDQATKVTKYFFPRAIDISKSRPAHLIGCNKDQTTNNHGKPFFLYQKEM